jgi:hypothetical protein
MKKLSAIWPSQISTNKQSRLKRAAVSSLALGGLAAGLSAVLVASRWIEFLGPIVIAATFSFLIAWLNKGLVAPNEGRFALVAGVALACAGTAIGLGVLALEITSS